MDTQEQNQNLATLRLILSQTPSTAVWHEFCSWIKQVEEPDFLQLATDYAASHLESWPGEMLVFYDLLEHHPAWCLGRHLVLYDSAFHEFQTGTLFEQVACSQFQHLEFRSTQLNHQQLVSLQSQLDFSKVETLVFYGCELTNDSLLLLAEESWDSLRHFELSMNYADLSAWHQLWNSSITQHLETLVLSGNGHTMEELYPLVETGAIQTLQELDLRRNQLNGEFAALLQNSSFACLKKLNLEQNQLSDEGVQALARSPWLRQLQELNLCGNGVTSTGAQALLGSTLRSPRLRMQLLYDNPIEQSYLESLTRHRSVVR